MVGLAFLVVIAAGFWLAMNPGDLSGILQSVWPLRSETAVLDVHVAGRPERVPAGGTLKVHPMDQMVIQGFQTNRWFNIGLSLKSPDLEISRLEKPVVLFELLGEETFFKPKMISVQILEGPNPSAEFFLDSSMTALDWAALAKAAQDPEKKVQYFRLALDLEPQNRLVAENLVKMYTGRKDYLGAAQVWEKYLGDGSDPQVLEHMLALYLKAGDKDQVVKVFHRLIASVPPRQAIPLQKKLAACQAGWGRILEAAQVYEALLPKVQGGEKKEFLKKLLQWYRKLEASEKMESTLRRLVDLGPPGEALGWMDQLVLFYEKRDRIPEVVAILKQKADVLPENRRAEVFQKIGLWEAKRKNWAPAVSAFEKAARLDPKDPLVQLNLARLYLLQGDHKKYVERLERFIELKPSDLDARQELVETYLKAGDKKKAESELKAILQQDSGKTESRLQLVQLLEEKGAKDELVQQYQVLVKQDPKNPVLLYNLGVLYFEKGDWVKAGARMEEVVEIQPQDSDAWQYLFDVYLKRKKDDLALDAARKLILLKPDESLWYEHVARFLIKKNDFQTLAREAREWVDRRPGDIPAWSKLAQAQEKLKNWAEARKAFQQLSRLDPKKLDYLFKVGELLEREKQYAEAGKVYERILKKDPNNQKAAEAHLRLQMKILKAKHQS